MGCAPSTPQDESIQQPRLNATHNPAHASKPLPEAEGKPTSEIVAKPSASHPNTGGQSRWTEDEDLSEVDRLLVSTKSQIQSNPLDLLSGEPHRTSRLQQQISQPHNAAVSSSRLQSQPLEPLHELPPEEPGTPPQSQLQSPIQNKPPVTIQPPNVPDDPWASLQSAYAIQGNLQGTGSPGAQPAPSGRPGLRAGHGNSWDKRHSQNADIIVLDADADDFGRAAMHGRGQPLYARQPPPPQHISAKPKQGGWGQGALAQAGTLMVGEEELSRLAPPKGATQQAQLSQTLDGDPEFERLKQRIKANQAASDLGVEDIEDIDDLIEQEEKRGGLSSALADKLAKFEAMADDD